jgi:hypothetical protein
VRHIPAWFPGAYFQRFAIKTDALQQEMRDGPIEITKAQLVSPTSRPDPITNSERIQAAGTAPVSIVARMLENDPSDQQIIKDMSATVYLAGSDTTVAAVTSFFLAALVYPEFQKRAQEELDRVVGRDRLPEFSDKADLPYLDAVMRECLRWLPVLPLGQLRFGTTQTLAKSYIGAPHSTTEDMEFRGYFIPKGTVTLPFQWYVYICHSLYTHSYSTGDYYKTLSVTRTLQHFLPRGI